MAAILAPAVQAVAHPEPAEAPQHVEGPGERADRAECSGPPAELAQIDEVIRRVARHQLVGTLTVDHHRDMLARLPHHAVLRVRSGRDHRLLLGPHEVAEVGHERLRVGFHLVHGQRVGALRRHRVDVAFLVVDLTGEHRRERLLASSEGLDVRTVFDHRLVQRGYDRRRVEPARQCRADRHVADQPAPDRPRQHVGEVLPGGLVVWLVASGKLPHVVEQAGVGVDADQTVRTDGGGLPRQQAHDAFEECAFCVVMDPVAQVAVDRSFVGISRQPPSRQQRTDLARKQCFAGPAGREVERLDAEMVARQHDRSRRGVGNGESEHSVEAVECRLTPLFVRRKHDLGVGGRTEDAPFPSQLVTQFAIVVDLAVVDEHEPAVGRHHRLPAAMPVDDREALVRKPEPVSGVRRPPVRSAMPLRPTHRFE